MKKAFTMIELVFVIVVIGILATIAIPKFAATRDDATLTKAKTTVANIRAAMSSEVQRRIFEGNYTKISSLGSTIGLSGYGKPIFDYFEGSSSNRRILEYPPRACESSTTTKGCWIKIATISTYDSCYAYVAPNGLNVPGGGIIFCVKNNRFECLGSNSGGSMDASTCRLLER